ncbi:MAG: transcription elongation factor GreA [Verrucomicrobia bacterium]|nr:MAG: transcription elongation factor GreA [Verrucomicrobiota bacterium]
MNSETISTLVAKNPSLKLAKAKLEAMEPGAYCVHKSWGFGRIKSFDAGTGKLHIDFKNKPGHPMDPAFCVNTLDVLPAAHLLVRKETDPVTLNKLISSDPAQLLIEALAAYPNSAATQIEIEIVFGQVLGEEKFKKWWSGAKKAIAKDPRISAPTKKTECYFVRETPVSTEDEITEKFKGTRSARLRVQLAEQLVDTASKQEIKADLPHILAGVIEAIKTSNQFDAAERLYAASVRDRLAKLAGVETAGLEPSQVSLVANVRDLPSIVEKVPVNFQADLLELLKEAHPLGYRDVVITLLKVSQGKFTTECINFLIENEHGEELAATFVRWMAEQNLRAPVLHWIVKNRNSKKFAKILGTLVSPRLLSAIFYAIDYEALQAASARRIPLADALSEDTELIPDLLQAASAETARDLAHSLLLNQGFEELTKKSLLARFIKLFPSISTVLTGENEAREEQLLVSRDSYERKREEYETIVSKKIPDNKAAIATAREHGDLKENSEYKMAKQDQTVLMAQKAQLEKDLSRARITDFKEAATDVVGVGSVVQVKLGSSGKTARYTLLGAWDSAPEKNVVSYKTPLGQALVGKKVGDTVKVKIGAAQEAYTITELGRYGDVA